MSSAARIFERWTAEEFDRWNAKRPEEVEVVDGVPYKVRYEFVDGLPLRMMTGVSREHSTVQMNVSGTLYPQLLDGPCAPHSSDFAVETFMDQRRYPDYAVQCDPDDDEPYVMRNVTLVLEVLSPTTRAFDLQRKVVEYQRMVSLEYILLVDPTRLDVRLWHRAEDRTWDYTEFTSMDETAELPAIGASLPIAAIYRRVEFPPPEGRSLPSA